VLSPILTITRGVAFLRHDAMLENHSVVVFAKSSLILIPRTVVAVTDRPNDSTDALGAAVLVQPVLANVIGSALVRDALLHHIVLELETEPLGAGREVPLETRAGVAAIRVQVLPSLRGVVEDTHVVHASVRLSLPAGDLRGTELPRAGVATFQTPAGVAVVRPDVALAQLVLGAVNVLTLGQQCWILTGRSSEGTRLAKHSCT